MSSLIFIEDLRFLRTFTLYDNPTLQSYYNAQWRKLERNKTVILHHEKEAVKRWQEIPRETENHNVFGIINLRRERLEAQL